MAKKYVPSGYQIIHVDLTNRDSLTGELDLTKGDNQLLLNILSSDVTKPILLKVGIITVFPLINGESISFLEDIEFDEDTGNLNTCSFTRIYVDTGKLYYGNVGY